MNKIVKAAHDGRGIIQVVKSGAEHPDYFFIGDKMLSITDRGQVKIPASIMRQYGVMDADGRYSLSLNIGARYDDGELVLGGNIINSKSKKFNKILTRGKTGDRIKARDIADAVGMKGTKVITPSETGDLYTA